MALLPPDPLFILKSNMGHIHNLDFMLKGPTTDVTHLLAVNEEGYLYFWNLKTNRSTFKQKLGDSVLVVHYISPHIITQEKSGVVKLWNVDSELNCLLVREYHCEGGFCRSIVVNQCLILPQAKSKMEAIYLPTFEKNTTYTPIQGKLGYAVALEEANICGIAYILAGYETGDIILYNFVNGEQCGHAMFHEHITSIAFDSVMGRGVCGNTSNVLQVFTIGKECNISLKCEITIKTGGCSVVRLRPDHKILACGSWDGHLSLFSWKSLRLLVVLNRHKCITDIIFSQETVPEWNSNVMSVAGGDGFISLWNLYNQ